MLWVFIIMHAIGLYKYYIGRATLCHQMSVNILLMLWVFIIMHAIGLYKYYIGRAHVYVCVCALMCACACLLEWRANAFVS